MMNVPWLTYLYFFAAASLAMRTLETLATAQFVVYEVSQVAIVAFG